MKLLVIILQIIAFSLLIDAIFLISSLSLFHSLVQYGQVIYTPSLKAYR